MLQKEGSEIAETKSERHATGPAAGAVSGPVQKKSHCRRLIPGTLLVGGDSVSRKIEKAVLFVSGKSHYP